MLFFLDRLFARGVLHATGVDGLYARGECFEKVISGLDRVISRHGAAHRAEIIRFPPGMSRALFEQSGYMNSFPQLAGSIHGFVGDERDHLALLDKIHNGETWTDRQVATDVVLTPAACYPLYPIVSKRGPVRADGLYFDVQSYCFRHEPSKDPARMQMFRMREYVCVGTPDQVMAFREQWLRKDATLPENSPCRTRSMSPTTRFLGAAARHGLQSTRTRIEVRASRSDRERR